MTAQKHPLPQDSPSPGLALVRRYPAAVSRISPAMLTECMSIFGELEDRRGMAVVFP